MEHYYEDVDNTYYEGVEITPEQESILDLVDQEQATSLGQHRIIAVNNRRTTAGNKKYNASESLRFQANTT